eukprot:Awhi_evm1s3158
MPNVKIVLRRDRCQLSCKIIPTINVLIYDFASLPSGTIVKVVASFTGWVYCIKAFDNDNYCVDDDDDNSDSTSIIRLPKSYVAPLKAPVIAAFKKQDLIEMLHKEEDDRVHPLFTDTLIEEVTRELKKLSAKCETEVGVEVFVKEEYQNLIKLIMDRIPEERFLTLQCLDIIYWICEGGSNCQLFAETR